MAILKDVAKFMHYWLFNIIEPKPGNKMLTGLLLKVYDIYEIIFILKLKRTLSEGKSMISDRIIKEIILRRISNEKNN